MRYHPTHTNVMYFITFMDRSKYFGILMKRWDCKRPCPRGWKNPNFFSEKPKWLASIYGTTLMHSAMISKLRSPVRPKGARRGDTRTLAVPTMANCISNSPTPNTCNISSATLLYAVNVPFLQHFLWLFMSLLPEKLEGRQRRRCEDQR